MFDETEVVMAQQKENIRSFVSRLKQLEHQKSAQLLQEGWKYIKTAERTVLFTFGEVVFSRRCYEKNGNYCYPIDDYLGLPAYTRFSKELLFELAELASKLSYRKAAEEATKLKHLFISKDTVFKAVKMVRQLYDEKAEFQYYKDVEIIKKVQRDVLYIEGDGVMVNTPSKGDETARTDLAHFVVHEGVKAEYGRRRQLIAKHEILSVSNSKAREQLLDYLINHYEITAETLIISNSDMGHGYTPYVFSELAATLRCKHEHFWDRYHLNEKIKLSYKLLPTELQEKLFSAIYNHDKAAARLILDTTEALIEDEGQLENFQGFSRKLLRDFQYTKPAKLRGLTYQGIGIMESQHTKITSRMKHRGMYWSVKGAETMARMIIDEGEQTLKDLFFGSWREDYDKIIQQDFKSVSHYLKRNKGKKGKGTAIGKVNPRKGGLIRIF